MYWQNRRQSWPILLSTLTLVGVLGCGGSPTVVQDEVPAAPAAQPDSSSSSKTSVETKVAQPDEPIPELPEGEADDGGYTIAQVMQIAHETKLYRRLYQENVPEEVLSQFTTLYADLAKRDSPDGDQEDWEKRAVALSDAVALIAGGDPGGVSQLKRAINCNSCHSRHRG